MAGMFEKPRPWWHGTHMLRAGLGLIFLFAGIFKLVDLDAFQKDVLSYQILLKQPAGWIALLLPVLEVIVGFFLIVGWARAGSLAAVILMSIGFAFVHIYTIQRNLDVKCGCFGRFSPGTSLMLVINTLMLGTAFWLLIDDLRRNVIEKPKYRLSNDLMRRRR
ncbi:MAG: DoxX family protein [Verrucomicrobiales bacterium]